MDIYKAIRNLILVNLILNRIVDNKELIRSVNREIGENLSEKLKSNKESKIEREIALLNLKRLTKRVLNELEKSKWEKIVLPNL